MSEWWGIKKQNDLKKLKQETNQFVDKLEKTLKDFDQNGDVRELGTKLKKSIKQFQKNVESF